MLNYIKFPEWLKPEIFPCIPWLPVRWYALMYIIAFSITYLLFKYQEKELHKDYKEDDVLNLFIWGIVGLILGARIFAITVYDVHGVFLKNPIISFLPISCEGGECSFTGFQGMSYHGGVIGCALGIIIYAKIKKLDVLEWLDLIVAGIPLGYTFGRLGNFINGELFGRVTTLPWGIQFPGARKLPAIDPWVKETAGKIGMEIDGNYVNLPRHPSQLYESFFEGIVIWAVIWFIFRKRKPFKGFIVGTYLIAYGVVRFILEYFRQPDIGKFLIELGPKNSPIYRIESLFNFTIGQLLCFFMVVGGILCLFIFSRIARNKSQTVKEEAPATE
jgi:phosphatidylglycerol---prolipoprotein diacylglyceryl transferase